MFKKKTELRKKQDISHDQYLMVPADKACDNIAIVCKTSIAF